MKTITVSCAELGSVKFHASGNSLQKILKKAGFDLSGYTPLSAEVSEDNQHITYTQED